MRILISLLIYFVVGLGSAHARNYAVELIVFQRTNHENPTDSVPVSQETIAQKRVHIDQLAAKSSRKQATNQLYKLAGIQKTLSSSGYRILRTARWVQGSHVYHRAPLMSIGRPGSALSAGFVRVYRTSLIFADIDLQLSPLTWSPWTTTPETSPPLQTPELLESTELEQAGTISVNQPAAQKRQPYFFISEKRRLKFKEVHYFDHPEFGVILTVWPA